MADVANAVVVSKETRTEFVDKTPAAECSDTNQANPTYTEVDSFSDLSFKTTDDVSLQDLIESEFAARISSLSAESTPCADNKNEFAAEVQDLLDFEQSQMSPENDDFNLVKEGEECRSNDFNLDDLISGPLKGDYSLIIADEDPVSGANVIEPISEESIPTDLVPNRDSPVDLASDECTRVGLLPNKDNTENLLPNECNPLDLAQNKDIPEDLLSNEESPLELFSNEENSTHLLTNCVHDIPEAEEITDFTIPESQEASTPIADSEVTAFVRPSNMPIISNFDPFARIEEDSDCSNSNPILAANVLSSPDEFPFPDSPQDPPVMEPMVDLFVKTVSDENLDLSDPVQGSFSRFQTSSVESVNNSFPNVSDLTSPDREDHEDLFSDDLASTEPVETIVEQDEGISHPVDLSTEETEQAFEDQSLHQEEQSGDTSYSLERTPSEADPPEKGPPEIAHGSSEPEEEESIAEDSTPIVEEGPFIDVEAVLPSAAPRSLAPIATGEDAEDWTTVEAALEITNPVTDVAAANIINTPEILVVPAEESEASTDASETETRNEVNSSEKRTSSKKKKKTSKTKTEEKENHISVDEEQSPAVTPSTASDVDDLANVSVRDLMQTYCSEATKSFEVKVAPEEIIPSPVPIHNLKARSMVDLSSAACNKVAALRCNLLQSSAGHSKSTNNLAALDRAPVVTGVSVQALKERYCSMVNLCESTPSELSLPPQPRRRLSVPWRESLKSSFSKFDQLSKKTVLHVRSVDSAKVQKQFNDASASSNEPSTNCKSCGKLVFQMEQIKAERALWHKNCFRCKECSKQLTVDTYSSHEGVLYCKPHFKQLFQPKVVLDDDPEPIRFRKPEMIIRENQPMELPPDVFRASDKPDLGLEELCSLNVKSRYQVFEKNEEAGEGDMERSPSLVNVKRSPSILSKLAKFQKKGMDIGVTDDSLNGVPFDQSPSSSEEEDEEEDESTSRKVVKSKKLRERPINFGKMEDVKSVWENGVAKTKEELREERKQEIQQIRSRLFMGKQVKMKEAYEQAVRESETVASSRKSIDVRCDKARSIKECFEKGEPLNVDDEEEQVSRDEKRKSVSEDTEVFEAGLTKKSRSLFLELDKSASQATINGPKATPRAPVATPRPQQVVQLKRQPSDDVVKASDSQDDVVVNSAEISNKFKFFETYKAPEKEKKSFRITPPREGQVKAESPEREVDRDPNVVRASDRVEPELVRTNTTAKMLSLFRQMEERTEEVPDGPKPLKCFTPPPDYKENEETENSEEEEEEDEEEEESEDEAEQVNPNLVRASDKVEDDYLKQSATAARAKQLRAKFERWEQQELQREQTEQQERKINGTPDVQPDNSDNVEVTSIECTKNLRARFESMRTEAEQPKEKVQRPKVNRFVELHSSLEPLCEVCSSRVYQLERVDTSGRTFHKSCFRCVQCNCLLRLETFTLNCGRLYCMPHFKQLFTVKGNYDEGFGVDQHKAKWPRVATC